ncbi:hypothetical protein ACFVT2_35890 [Streptomyces sp. NPDC058000]
MRWSLIRLPAAAGSTATSARTNGAATNMPEFVLVSARERVRLLRATILP